MASMQHSVPTQVLYMNGLFRLVLLISLPLLVDPSMSVVMNGAAAYDEVQTVCEDYVLAEHG